MGPASQDLTNEKSYKAFLEGDDVGVVGYFEKDDSALAAAYLLVTKKLRGKARFAHTSTKQLLESAGHKYIPLLLVKETELFAGAFELIYFLFQEHYCSLSTETAA